VNDTALLTAIGAIVDADATMQTLCARASNLLVDWDSRHKATPPFVALLVVELGEKDATDYWEGLLQFEVVADADLETVNKMAHRLAEILTHTNLWAQGVDAAPVGLLRQRRQPAEDELLQESWVFTLFEMDVIVR
jgi:hypothetical protein